MSTCLVLCPGELMWRKRMGASEGFRLGGGGEDGLGLVDGDKPPGPENQLPLSTSPKSCPLLTAASCPLHPRI